MSADVEETTADETVEQEPEAATQEPEQEAAATETPPEEEPTTEAEAVTEEAEPEATETVTEAEEEPSPEWITDDVRALAGSYGIDDAELASFSSPFDFQRACRLVDQALMRAHAPAQAEPEPEPQPEPEPEPEPGSQPQPEPQDDDLTLDLSKYEDWDDESKKIVRVLKRLQEQSASRDELDSINNTMRGEFDRLEQDRQRQAVEVEQSRFDEILDKNYADFFGDQDGSTEETDKRRETAWNAYRSVVEIQAGLNGGDTSKLPRREVLVKRAIMMEFGDDLFEAQRKGIYREIHEQSKGRRPPPGRGKAGAPPPKTSEKPWSELSIAERTKLILADPDIARIFDKADEEAGIAPQ